MSLATTVPLEVGDEVELTPVVTATLRALVKHNQRTMYGVQFIALAPELHDRLVELCRRLPLFQTMADI